jgi:hypothetical protein
VKLIFVWGEVCFHILSVLYSEVRVFSMFIKFTIVRYTFGHHFIAVQYHTSLLTMFRLYEINTYVVFHDEYITKSNWFHIDLTRLGERLSWFKDIIWTTPVRTVGTSYC